MRQSTPADFFENMDRLLAGRAIDYLVVTIWSRITALTLRSLRAAIRKCKIVGIKNISMIRQFYDFSLDDRCIEVREGDSLTAGRAHIAVLFCPYGALAGSDVGI